MPESITAVPELAPRTSIARRGGRALTVGILALCAGAAVAAVAAAAAEPAVRAVDSVAVTVGDIDAARDFYRTVLAFEPMEDTELSGDAAEHLYGVFGLRLRIATLRLGEERLQLEQFLAPRGRAFPADSNSNDRWFQHIAIIVSDMDKAFAWLRAHKVAFASSGPQLLPAWNKDAGGISAFYFRDPDGHYLEVLHFPPGKGNPKWQQVNGRLFLGIDHTAIVVGDTDASLAFYRDRLGMKIAGTSENYGTEQEHLNNVFGARLRITALRAAQGPDGATPGPGIELLEYLAPRTGRPMPADTRANDLWHWQINLDSSFGAPPMVISDPDGHSSLLEPRTQRR